MLSERIKKTDIYKGIGIVLMIMGHVYFRGKFDIWIHAFHMPMFFFISGYLFKRRNFFKFIKRKFSSLIIPYLKFGLFNFIMCLILIPGFNLRIVTYFKNMFLFNNYNCLDITGALWFLTCLFWVNLLFFVIIKYSKGKIPFLICILLPEILYFKKIMLPLSLDSAIYMLPIFYAGYEFKKVSDKFSDVKNGIDIVFGIILLTAFSFILFKNGFVNVRCNIYSNILMFYINAICMSAGIYYFSKLVENLKLFNCIEYCGKYSLNFMCLNQLVIFILRKLDIKNDIIVLILTFLILTAVNEVLNHIKNKKESLKTI